ncbi:hypothetical protein [Deinococcus koreensis]|uniref:Nuclear transport factor 2 family protein n=1 Tax=Deinococcus koreensis TaxID=2054903 RepID=A0A2K3UXI5_9DEIO|nr:hypothetical protein [Deinococcus koreensis]PNY81253.1 hypothetical protein CVO96_07520 [Deinococcus koreensis]
MNRILRVVTLALTLVFPAAQAQAGAPTARPETTARSAAETFALTRGRALMLEFYAVRLDGLWDAFTPGVRGQWGDLPGFRAFRETGVRQYGRETQLVEERTFVRAGETFYVRSAVFEGAPQQVWALVIGFTGLRVTTFAIGLQEDRSGDQVAWSAARIAESFSMGGGSGLTHGPGLHEPLL